MYEERSFILTHTKQPGLYMANRLNSSTLEIFIFPCQRFSFFVLLCRHGISFHLCHSVLVAAHPHMNWKKNNVFFFRYWPFFVVINFDWCTLLDLLTFVLTSSVTKKSLKCLCGKTEYIYWSSALFKPISTVAILVCQCTEEEESQRKGSEWTKNKYIWRELYFPQEITQCRSFWLAFPADIAFVDFLKLSLYVSSAYFSHPLKPQNFDVSPVLRAFVVLNIGWRGCVHAVKVHFKMYINHFIKVRKAPNRCYSGEVMFTPVYFFFFSSFVFFCFCCMILQRRMWTLSILYYQKWDCLRNFSGAHYWCFQ